MTGVDQAYKDIVGDKIPTFEEVQERRRRRIRKNFKSAVKLNDEQGNCCFKFSCEEEWFMAELASGRWKTVPTNCGLNVVLSKKALKPEEKSLPLSWHAIFEIILLCGIAILLCELERCKRH